MVRAVSARRVALVCAVGAVALAQAPLPAQQLGQPRPAGPRLEPVAETHLLMEGLAQANFRGLSKMLKEKPTEAEAWTFARGQALLIAETGNLLLLRPPKNSGERVWMERAVGLRDSASSLARAIANRDYNASRNGLHDLAAACTHCHQTFRVNAKVAPFAD